MLPFASDILLPIWSDCFIWFFYSFLLISYNKILIMCTGTRIGCCWLCLDFVFLDKGKHTSFGNQFLKFSPNLFIILYCNHFWLIFFSSSCFVGNVACRSPLTFMLLSHFSLLLLVLLLFLQWTWYIPYLAFWYVTIVLFYSVFVLNWFLGH